MAKHDFTNPDQVVEFLNKNLSITGYGDVFVLHESDTALSEDDAKAAVIAAIDLSQYQRGLRKEANPEWYEVWVEKIDGQLIFEHSDVIRFPVSTQHQIVSTEVSARRAAMLRAAKARKDGKIAKLQEKKQEELTAKLERLQDTSQADYLRHVSQCGFLARNVKLYFVRTKNQWSSSVKTRISNLTLDQLQSFIDATGTAIMADLTTHISDDSTKGKDLGLEGQHREFANAVVEFLNLEFIVDVDAILEDYRVQFGDSGFRGIEEWGGSRDIVLGRLIERRPDIDRQDIVEFFDSGLPI